MQKLNIAKPQPSQPIILASPTPTFIRLDSSSPYTRGIRATSVERFGMESGTLRIYTQSRHSMNATNTTREQYEAALREVLASKPSDDSAHPPLTFRAHPLQPEVSLCPAAIDAYAFGQAGFTLYLRSGAFFGVPTNGVASFAEAFTTFYGAEREITRVRPVEPAIPADQMVNDHTQHWHHALPFTR